jgi:hypothetical protein
MIHRDSVLFIRLQGRHRHPVADPMVAAFLVEIEGWKTVNKSLKLLQNTQGPLNPPMGW